MPDKPEGNVNAGDNPDAAQQTPNPPNPPIIKGNKNPEGAGDESNGKNAIEHKPPKHWVEYIEGLCAIALVFITGFYTYYASKQLSVMERQLNVMRNGERPWIKVMPTEIVVYGNRHIVQVAQGQPAEFLLKIINIGKSPAQNIVFKSYVDLPQISTGPRLECVDEKIYCSHEVVETGTIFPGGDFSDTFHTMERGLVRPVTEAEQGAWNSGFIYGTAYGIVTYDDEFGVHHWTKFCFWDPGNAKSPVSAMSCARYSDTDRRNN